MIDKQQNDGQRADFEANKGSEATGNRNEGTESIKPEHQFGDTNLMEGILDKDNLKRAYKAVLRNAGSAGIDGLTTSDLGAYLAANWARVRTELLAGTYKPKPVKRAQIPKPGGGKRALGIPTVIDRFIQQAVMQVLQKQWDATFSEHSYGFRPKRSAPQAVQKAKDYIQSGMHYVVDLDLEKFFDRVNHDILMSRVAKRISDKRVLKLLRAYLNAGAMEHGLAQPTDEGMPQGGPLSPLLSNLLLDELDRELEKRKLHFVRYADDCNIYVASERAGKRVMESITRFLAKRLKLKVNEEKSAVGKPSWRKFLGFSFHFQKKVAKIRIAPQSVTRFKQRIREITKPTRGHSLNVVIRDLRRFVTGWYGYFKICETRSVLRALDVWIRHRLRSYLWRQWRTGRRRFAELTARGVEPHMAALTARSPKGPWRLGASLPVELALPNAYFYSLGLPVMGSAA